MAGNVFRFDPPVRLPALGIAALIAVAAAPPLPAKVVDASAYVRPPESTLREQKPLRPWAALFTPADPVYRYSGRVLQNIASYPYPTPQDARIEWTVLKPRAPWFATFAPADPVYRYGGRVLQSIADYPYPIPQDARREWLPLKPWYAAFVIPPQFPYLVVNQTAAYVRPPEQRNEWLKILAPWFGPFAPGDPVYAFAGPPLQDVASYPYPAPQDARREWLPLQPSTLLFNITKTTPHTPILGLFYPGAPPVRVEAGKPWFAIFATADPIYVYNGPQVQQAAYVRPPEQRNEWLDNLAPWYASFDVGPLYPFAGAVVQEVAPYLRDAALPQLSVRFTQGTVVPTVPYVGLPYIAQSQETQRYATWNAAPFIASDTIPPAVLPTLARTLDSRLEAARPWFAVFAPADPAYNYAGPVLQAIASYPYPIPQDARREWKPLAPWFAAYATADPFYPFAGRVLQPLAPYQREGAFPQLSVRFTVSADTIAPQPLARFDRRDPALPQLATLYTFPPPVTIVSAIPALPMARTPETRVEVFRQWYALFSPANPFYPFVGRIVQPLAPYLRDSTLLPQLSVRFTQGTVATYIPPASLARSDYRVDVQAPQISARFFTASSDSIPLQTLARWDLRVESASPQPLIRFTSGAVVQVPYTAPLYSARVDGALQQPTMAWAPFVASDTVLSTTVSRTQIREPWLPQRFTLVGAPATASDAITPMALMRSQAREREGLWQQPKDYGTASLTTPSAFNFAGPRMQLSAAYLREVARPWLADQRLPAAFQAPSIWTSDPRYLVRLETRNYKVTLNARNYTVTLARRNWRTVLAARDYRVTLLKRNWKVRR